MASGSTGLAHSPSSFTTRLTLVLTGKCRISAGSNGFSISDTEAMFVKAGSSQSS